MTNLESKEGSSNLFTTTYPYEVDLAESGLVTHKFFPPSLIRRILRRTWIILKTASLNTLSLSWEIVTFSTYFLVFIQKRVVAFVYFLEGLKDLAVRTLMWRRGLLFRPTTHGGLLAISSVAFVVGSLFTTSVAPQDFTRDRVLAAANTPETIIPEGRPRSEVVIYEVRKGDKVSKIAAAYNISVDSIKWANNLTDVDAIKPGDNLKIPPISGILHKVRKGDSLKSLAKKYRADAQTLAVYPFNYIDDTMALRVGQLLIIPGGKKPEPKPVTYYASSYQAPAFKVPTGSGLFARPVAGPINQYPSWFHPAIDIGAPYGASVRAAGTGTVTTASYKMGGFGYAVFIDHGGGYVTAYAHLGSIKARVGQRVSRGQVIGSVGCTGFCTGPHLHFEVHKGGSSINPLSVL